jgi:hypothetical protein
MIISLTGMIYSMNDISDTPSKTVADGRLEKYYSRMYLKKKIAANSSYL